MTKDKISEKVTYIEEKKVEKELKDNAPAFMLDGAKTNPIKSDFLKFRLNKTKAKFDDLV